MLLVSYINIFSQSKNIFFNDITLKEGLESFYIRALCQDQKGFIWIGSEHGIQRYDGYRFWNYQLGTAVLNIIEDSRGLFVGGGFVVFFVRVSRETHT